MCYIFRQICPFHGELRKDKIATCLLLPPVFFCHLPLFERHVTSLNQGLSSLRWKTLGTRLIKNLLSVWIYLVVIILFALFSKPSWIYIATVTKNVVCCCAVRCNPPYLPCSVETSKEGLLFDQTAMVLVSPKVNFESSKCCIFKPKDATALKLVEIFNARLLTWYRREKIRKTSPFWFWNSTMSKWKECTLKKSK